MGPHGALYGPYGALNGPYLSIYLSIYLRYKTVSLSEKTRSAKTETISTTTAGEQQWKKHYANRVEAPLPIALAKKESGESTCSS